MKVRTYGTDTRKSEKVDTSDEWITSRTGIKARRIANEKEATSDLAVKAAQNALIDAGLTAQDIDLIIVATITQRREELVECLTYFTALWNERVKAPKKGDSGISFSSSAMVLKQSLIKILWSPPFTTGGA